MSMKVLGTFKSHQQTITGHVVKYGEFVWGGCFCIGAIEKSRKGGTIDLASCYNNTSIGFAGPTSGTAGLDNIIETSVRSSICCWAWLMFAFHVVNDARALTQCPYIHIMIAIAAGRLLACLAAVVYGRTSYFNPPHHRDPWYLDWPWWRASEACGAWELLEEVVGSVQHQQAGGTAGVRLALSQLSSPATDVESWVTTPAVAETRHEHRPVADGRTTAVPYSTQRGCTMR